MIAPFPHDTPALFPEQQAGTYKVKSNEWYTPSVYIEAARRVMGSIDLDPASCELANRTVRAAHYYTERENGLTLPWAGRIWLNPPFGRVNGSGASKIKMFTSKLIDEYKAGHVTQAILLSTVQTNSTWFQLLWDYPLCFLSRRLHFNKFVNGRFEVESRESHMLGTVFAYLGPSEQKFVEEFSQFGTIAKRVSGPHKEIAPLSLWEGVTHA